MSEKLSLPISIIIAGLLIGGGIYLNGRITSTNIVNNADTVPTNQSIKNAIRPVDVNDHIIGNSKARIVVIEYSDTECPFCKVFHSTMLSIMQEYGNQGKVAWVYRHYPIAQIHSKAPREAEALECAASLGGNTKFWEYANKLYEVTPSNNKLEDAELPKIASQVGLSASAFSTCLDSGEFGPRVNADLKNAQEMGASGTPYSVLIDTETNEYYPIEGAYPYAQIKNVIDLILNS